MLVLRREIMRKGGATATGHRSACTVNTVSVPLKLLKALGSQLLDINGQVLALRLGTEQTKLLC